MSALLYRLYLETVSLRSTFSLSFSPRKSKNDGPCCNAQYRQTYQYDKPIQYWLYSTSHFSQYMKLQFTTGNGSYYHALIISLVTSRDEGLNNWGTLFARFLRSKTEKQVDVTKSIERSSRLKKLLHIVFLWCCDYVRDAGTICNHVLRLTTLQHDENRQPAILTVLIAPKYSFHRLHCTLCPT